MRRRGSVVAAITSSACFGTLAVLAKLAYEGNAQPLQLLAWRFSLAALVLGAFVTVRRPGSLRIPAGDVARYALLSVTGYGAASICFFFALRTSSAPVIEILLFTYPAMVAVAEPLLGGPRFTLARFAAVAATFAGCVLVVDPFSSGGRVGLAGLLLGLGAAAGYANFSILSARLLPGRSRLTLMTYMFAFAALLSVAAAVMTGDTLSPASWEVSVWPILGIVVLVPTFAAVLLYLAAIRSLGASQAALLSTSEPIFTIAFAAFFLGDHLVGIQWVGAALVLGGVVGAEVSARGAFPEPTAAR